MPASATALLCALCAAAPSGVPLDGWRPDVAAARAYAAGRPGVVSFAVRTEDRVWGHRTRRAVPTASVLKAMLLVAYLRRGAVRERPLSARDRALLSPMVRRSDDVAATRVRDVVGDDGLRRLAHASRLPSFRAHTIWGMSRLDARDGTRLMLGIEALLPPRHRAYALTLLRTVVAGQRWGIAQVAPRGWRLYFKGGWGSGSGAVDHQVALLARGEQRVAIAIMTTGNGSHAAGKATLRGVAARLVRGLAAATREPARGPSRPPS